MVEPDGLPTPRRYWAIFSIALAIVIAVLDGTIANVALPTIARDFNADAASSIWIVNAYQIAVVVAILPLSSLGEVVGFRRVSQAGLVVFTIASLACALSDSLLTLSAARVLQGFGAAGIMSVNSALVRHTYPQRLLGVALGLNAFLVSMAAVIGPTIASAILAVGHWRWLFGVNVPIGVAATLIAAFALPQTEQVKRPLNYAGAALSVATFGLLVTGLQTLAHGGAWIAVGVLEVASGALAAIAFYKHERPRAAPLIPFDLLSIRLFRLSIMTSVASFSAQMLAMVAMPFEFQRIGYSAVEIGLLITPWPLALAFSAPFAGRLADRYPPGLLGAIGLVTFAAGLVAVALLPAGHSSWDLFWRMALCGLGFGFFQSPNNRAILSVSPRSRSGAAGGMIGTARLVGQSLGAVAAALLFRTIGEAGPLACLYVAAALSLGAAFVSSLRLREGEKHGAPLTQETIKEGVSDLD